MGFLLRIKVHTANIGEREGGQLLLSELQKAHPKIELVWADMGYSGPEFANWVQTETGATVEIVKRPRRRFRVKEGEEPPQLPPEPAGFKILPRRWVVERSFAWLGKYRRLSKDYEAAVQHSESMIYLGNDSIDAQLISSKIPILLILYILYQRHRFEKIQHRRTFVDRHYYRVLIEAMVSHLNDSKRKQLKLLEEAWSSSEISEANDFCES